MSPSPILREEPLPPFSPSGVAQCVLTDVKAADELDGRSPSTHTVSLPARSRSPSESTSHPHTPQDSSSSTPSASTSSHSPGPIASTSQPPKPKAVRKPKEKVVDAPPVLMDHLPVAKEEAGREFVALTTNHHQFNTLGRSHQDEDAMVCDCSFRPGTDDAHYACGEGSGCINRLTQVECLESECRSREHCQNQRFTRKEYANIEVVKTERKGYGLRAAQEIENDAFIYEYIGEVVQQSTFMKRMREYAASGIRHFYFMMLQKDEFLDATKKGGIGRFANHSCNPNCYVAKWVVGKRMRMGIFAKRDILKGEELTFNYNVDRYGHDAQPCYCDEPNCVGSIGGKTQTDVGGMDDLYLDALGIADEVEELGLKGNKRRKGKKLGEDFMPVLKPVEEFEVPKLIAAIRQATANRPMLTKLLSRIKMTEDDAVKRQVMRMHGFNLMSNVLRDFADDKDVVKLALESMAAWPMQARNKIVDSKIVEAIHRALERPEAEDPELQAEAQRLLESWSKLPMAYRIAKRVVIPDAGDDKEGSEGASPAVSTVPIPATPTREYSQNPFLPTSNGASSSSGPVFSMPTPTARPDPSRMSSMSHGSPAPSQNAEASASQPAPSQISVGLAKYLAQLKADRDAKEVQRVASEAAAAALVASASASSSTSGAGETKKRKKSSLGGSRSTAASSSSLSNAHASGSGSEIEGQKERRLMKLVGEVVVRTMSKYKDQIGDSDRFKKYAKECTDLIVRKEKQSPTYRALTVVPPPLSDEKQAKMKKFSKEFAHRLIKKIQTRAKAKSKSNGHGGSSSTGTNGTPNGDASTSTAATTPNDLDEPMVDLNDEMEEYGVGDESMLAEEVDGVEDALMTGAGGSHDDGATDDPGGSYGHGGWGDEEEARDGGRGLKDPRLSSLANGVRLGGDRLYVA